MSDTLEPGCFELKARVGVGNVCFKEGFVIIGIPRGQAWLIGFDRVKSRYAKPDPRGPRAII